MARILVIDSLPIHARALTGLLEEMGHQAHYCADSRALENASDYDLVLIDLHHEQCNGFELSVHLLACGARVVALFTYIPRVTDADWGAALGVSAVIAMPISFAAFKEHIQRLLSTSSSPEPAQ